ncbi:MAG: Bax inhibitor-1 family protein [Rhodothermaceae bacterium]|nr:Bax inhibitor-1 family protein [Rhodothermaceae bacterium]
MSSQYGMPAASMPVAYASVEERADFITKTYMHLFGAMIAFTLIEVYLFTSGLADVIAGALLGVGWWVVLGGFMVVGWFASRTAMRATSAASQYGALAAFVVAEAIIFVPMLYYAMAYAPTAINSAAIVTLLGFAALTAVAFTTRKDFSFLGGLLRWGFICALILIGASFIFGFQLGTFFSVGMIAFAGGAILYDTSNVLHHYPQDRHVAAALSLFASVALMFWYVLQLFLSRD